MKLPVLCLIALVICFFTACDEADTDTVISYEIYKEDNTPSTITYRILIDRRTDKDSLIEVARQLKKEKDWDEKLVCFFFIKVPSDGGAWASVGYLPKCSDCETDKDKDGNPVQFRLIGMSKEQASNLEKLRLDSIENKTLIASYIDETWKCKTELYSLPDKPNKVLKASLFSGNEKTIEFLTVDKSNAERYGFDDEEGFYIQLNKAEGIVTFHNKEGKVFREIPLL